MSLFKKQTCLQVCQELDRTDHHLRSLQQCCQEPSTGHLTEYETMLSFNIKNFLIMSPYVTIKTNKKKLTANTLEVLRQGMPNRPQSDSNWAIIVRSGATTRHMVPDAWEMR